ncbi:ATP-binding cassette domain-containing protein [Actinomycetes bacterium KLBMP 9797]
MAEPVLEARQASRRYAVDGRLFAAVQDVDVAIQAGEVLGIGGPSGAGKSTLLRLLAAIEPPDRGEVLLGGGSAWQRRWTGMRRCVPRPGFVMPVFQDPRGSLDGRWPIWRSITEPLVAVAATRLSRKDRKGVARDLLAGVGLAHLDLGAAPHELSVGQCQRVVLARAMAARPAALAADEPTSALDLPSAAGVMRLLREVADRGTAVVVVSHDQRMLHALADRVVHMVDGQMSRAEDRYS